MSGSLIGGVLGAAIGYVVGGPAGAYYGYAIGGMAGALIDPQKIDGPRLSDLKPQASEYGRPIPIVYGTVAMGGNVIWASDYIDEEGDSGGKGGPSVTTHTYYGNFAVAFAEGPASIGRMWAGPEKRLIWDGTTIEGGSVRIYTGTEDQLPDPLIESYLGVGNVPAFRGTCYVVFERFPLAKDGNTLPFITAEVGAKASGNGKPPVHVAETIAAPNFSPAKATMERANGWIWNVSQEFLGSGFTVTVISDALQSVVATFPISTAGMFTSVTVKDIAVVPAAGKAFVLLQAWALDTRRAVVASFSLGQAAEDGSVLVAPTYEGISQFGNPATNSPMDPQAIGANSSQIWIAYSFTNATLTHMAVYPATEGTQTYTEIWPGQVIGFPFEVLGDDQYMGVMGRSGPGEVNFQIYDAAAMTLLHSTYLPTALDGKAFDYDPKRKAFIAFENGGMHWYSIDAATGVVTTHLLTVANTGITPTPTEYAAAITYSSRTDRYLIGSSSTGAGGTDGTTVYVVNPDSGNTDGTYTFEAGGQMISPLLDPITKTGAPYVLSFDQNNVKRLYIGGTPAPASIGLGAIVADLSERAGESRYDVSQLTDEVPGYAISRQTTVRNAIDALRPAYYFDAVESDGVIKYVKRGGAPIATIPLDDLDARNAGDAPGDPLLTTRQMEVELPRVVNVNYMLEATDYSPATKLAKRLVGASGTETTLDLPLVLSDTKGQEVADVNLQVAWVQRLTYAFNLPRRYSYLEPTDHIVINGNGMRLTKVTHTPHGVLKCEAVADGSSYYTSNTPTTETPANQQSVYIPGTTSLELM